MQLTKPVKVKKARKPIRKTRRQKYEGVPTDKRLDDLARFLCHKRARCEAQGFKGHVCNGGYQWCHVIPREYKRNGLRWRADNCLLMCSGAHFRWTKKNQVEWREFLYWKLGLEKVLRLEAEAIDGEKLTAPMRMDIQGSLIRSHMSKAGW